MSKKSAAVRSRTHAAAASAPSGASAVVSAAPAGVPPLALGVALSILIHAFVLAINFASVVPKEAVEAAAGDFGKKPVGTGAFKLAEWTLGQRLVFEKNPDYWISGVPYLDSFTVEVGQEPVVALLRAQNGEVDIPGDGIPPAKFVEVM